MIVNTGGGVCKNVIVRERSYLDMPAGTFVRWPQSPVPAGLAISDYLKDDIHGLV